MHKHILVTGANGQLGSEIKAISASYQDFNFLFTDRDNLDIRDKESLKKFCSLNSISTIINCAAYTAVDKAESDVESADKINHFGVKYLAEVAKDQGISFIHISTDYVFDGNNHRPYLEDDTVNPQGVYGKTKLLGENALLKINPANSVIIRTSWVYSSFGNNFVKTMLHLGRERDELGIIFDQVGTPTYAKDLAQVILNIVPELTNHTVEIFNFSNEGVCSWYDFAKTIFELSNVQCKVKPIESKEYPTPATRPHYSLLNKSKIKNHFNIEIPYWKESLKECLTTLKETT